ncbi:hypothetical protein M413DRAFT_443902 [Hebeloma cylindrosporum]|uniref:Uncharacterized protein n=1 Tax=Hebeloma cylindrosporum TaxID=76867 RepID=A0A0C3CG17_HEBCY|nr:hypothetical protein M413DRAFT_443902 [Hebeloma cylindrosporum h7]
MASYLFRRARSDDTQNTVLDALFIAAVSILFALLIAVSILHCIVRRRERRAGPPWTSSRNLCLITPQSKLRLQQVLLFRLSPEAARDLEKAVEKASSEVSNPQPSLFSLVGSDKQPVPLVALRSSSPTGLVSGSPLKQ